MTLFGSSTISNFFSFCPKIIVAISNAQWSHKLYCNSTRLYLATLSKASNSGLSTKTKPYLERVFKELKCIVLIYKDSVS